MTNTSLRTGFLTLSLLAAGMLVGCGGGGSGPDRVSVSGTVTVGGEPVEVAQIQFEPKVDKSDVSNAPTAFGYVKNGEYSIPEVTGAIVGEHQVRVRIVKTAEGEEEEETVVGEFRTSATVQADGDHVHNFAFDPAELIRPEDEEQ